MRFSCKSLGCWLLGVAALGILPAHPASAGDEIKQQCLGAYEAGQRLRLSGDLVNAAGELRLCGGPRCPVRMQGDCQRWLDDVERSTPTVIFRVRNARGELLANVMVSIDGAEPLRLDGRALQLNPGEHRAEFEHPGYQTLKTSVFVTEGEKLEPRHVTLAPRVRLEYGTALVPASPLGRESNGMPMGDSRSAISVWPLVLGATGLVGSASFVYFGVRARSGENDLDRCSPSCSQARVEGVKSDYLWSNVSMGVGLASLVGAGLWLLLDQPSPLAPPPRHGVRLGPTPSWVMSW